MKLLSQILAWIEDRTGLIAMMKPILQHRVPSNARWLYVFGSATLVAFLLQVFTGTLLSLAYVPSTSAAYQTLQFISHDVMFGRILRGMHYFGASAMILLMGIHMIRTFLMAAYKYPREVNWISGVFLLGLTLVMGFTGQLLRWDQNAVWSVVVGTEQAGRVPIVGKQLAHFLMGGDVMGAATLSRFFSAHVFFLPGIMFAIIGLHLYLVIRNGISLPPERNTPVILESARADYAEDLKKNGVPFFPNSGWRDILFGSCVILVIVALAIFIGPLPLGKPPDPTILQAQPKPDWYLLWYFAVLALMPHKIESYVMVLGPVVAGLGVLILPVIFNKGLRHPSERPWSVVIVIAVVTTIIAFTIAGYQSNWSPVFDPQALPPSVINSSDTTVMAGAQLFMSKACLDCHQVSDHGGKRGPDLTLVARRLTRQDLIIRIANGGYNMPPYGSSLTSQELTEIVAFLETRK